LAYDPEASKVVLFSGVGAPADTWTWDGTNWTEQHPAQSPPARQGAALAYESDHGYTVLFGGFSSTATNLADTWLYRVPGS
jgi:hypothetical protein